MKQDDDVIDSQRSRRKKYTRRSFLINRSFGNSLLCILGRDFQTLNNKNLASFPRSRKLKNGDRHTRDAPYLYYTLSLNARKVLVSSSFRERERETECSPREEEEEEEEKIF